MILPPISSKTCCPIGLPPVPETVNPGLTFTINDFGTSIFQKVSPIIMELEQSYVSPTIEPLSLP